MPQHGSISAGARLGPYEILSLVGVGGMGEVYKARDTRLDRVVALKVSSEHFSERFEREARAVAALNHPNICQLYDVGPNYLVMEYIDGQTLKGPLPLDVALKYAAQICDALEAAHSKGITHRDLKPENILKTKSGIKLLDFGLAKRSVIPEAGDNTQTIALTKEKTILGTLQHMAPEQLEAKPADARSDIFAFGTVLYEMVTGRRAFEGKSPASLISAIMSSEPAPMNAVQPMASPALDRVVRTCLAKDPEERWQSARDVKHALQCIQEPATAVIRAWSPDGQSLVFNNLQRLQIAELSGGPRQTLCSGLSFYGPSWGAAGVILFARNTGPLSGPRRWGSVRGSNNTGCSAGRSRSSISALPAGRPALCLCGPGYKRK